MITLRSVAYPAAKLGPVVDNYFGRTVADPYRWLENLESKQTGGWLETQQKFTRRYLEEPETVALHRTLTKRLTALWAYPKYSVVAKEGPYYFFWGRDLSLDALQNYAILYRTANLGGEKTVILDPARIDPTGYTSVASQSISPDGQFVAYALATHGSDWQTLKIRNNLTLADFPETLQGLKLGAVAWKPGNAGFYYNCFWPFQPDEASEQYACVFWHVPGTPHTEDKLVYRCPEPASSLSAYPQVTDDGEYLVLTVVAGAASTNRVLFRRTGEDGPFSSLLDKDNAGYIFLGNRANIFYFQTDLTAPKGKVVAIELSQPDPANWQTVVEEKAAVLDFGLLVDGRLVLVYLEEARHTLSCYRLDGTFEKELTLPLTGSVTGLTGRYDHMGLFLSLENFHCPARIYHYSFETNLFELVFNPATNRPIGEIETHRIAYFDLDGTPITLNLVYKAGLRLNGNNPTILYGYGGFGQNMTPFYWLSQQLWLEQGGVLAVAHIRGGGENGQEWHEAARRGHRQTAIGDFCQAAHWLIEAGYTRPDRLGIWGASNGGLLVAACLTQQPGLFGAAICQVPLTDMLRYQHFGAGRSWISEFGESTSSREEFEWLWAYSPLHKVGKADYPATLVTVALGDQRVHPMHGMKFAAALQAENQGEKPILLRTDPANGHGLDKPVEELIEETADIYTFLFQNLKVGFAKDQAS
jgi:prolyl oligopeptidase